MRKIFLIAVPIFLLSMGIELPSVFLHISGIKSALAKDFDVKILLEAYTGKYIKSSKNNKATKKIGKLEASRRYIYEKPTVKNLSHLFWSVGLYKIDNDDAIDKFIRINECEIYNNYNSDELEWKRIKEATKNFINKNKADFPTRFEFIMPLKLGEYNEEKGAFELQNKYKIDSLRRFELGASDVNKNYCQERRNDKTAYPRIIVLEFSRPFSLLDIPLEKKAAADYMKRKKELFLSTYSEDLRKRNHALALRNAYLVMKVKIFGYGEFMGINYSGHNTVQMMGVLEGFEIYEKMNKENLFFAQNYVTTQNKGKLDDLLKEQYKMLLVRHKGEGILKF